MLRKNFKIGGISRDIWRISEGSEGNTIRSILVKYIKKIEILTEIFKIIPSEANSEKKVSFLSKVNSC